MSWKDPDYYKYALYDCKKCGRRNLEWHDWKYTQCVTCHSEEKNPLLAMVKDVSEDKPT